MDVRAHTRWVGAAEPSFGSEPVAVAALQDGTAEYGFGLDVVLEEGASRPRGPFAESASGAAPSRFDTSQGSIPNATTRDLRPSVPFEADASACTEGGCPAHAELEVFFMINGVTRRPREEETFRVRYEGFVAAQCAR